jgi:hypothetical protein
VILRTLNGFDRGLDELIQEPPDKGQPARDQKYFAECFGRVKACELLDSLPLVQFPNETEPGVHFVSAPLAWVQQKLGIRRRRLEWGDLNELARGLVEKQSPKLAEQLRTAADHGEGEEQS